MKSVSTLLVAFFLTQPALARFVVGNGGDAITCQQSSDNKLDGMYSLDYVVTLTDSRGDDGLTPVKSWKDSSERIYNLLLVKAPTLAPYFREFRESVFNKDYSKSKVWEQTPFGLVELDDQNITSLIPENCKKDGKVQITQAVIRQFSSFSGTESGNIIYKYDPNVVASLDKNEPLQLSMLMVHEWLWDLSQNVDRNRRINRFLHSREIETMAPEVVVDNLKGMGFIIPGEQADIFDDRLCQGPPMKQSEFDERFPKTFTMVNWGALQIAQRNRFFNCPADLSGCHGTWGDLRYPNEVFNNYSFSLSPNWVDGNREYPLKIVSPEYFTKTGSYFRQGYGQFSCRFVDDPHENIECKLEDRTLLYPVFGRIDNSDFSKQPTKVMKGLLTNECFRIKVRSTYSNWNDTNIDTGEETHITSELETVFYVRAKKGTFLNPQ